MGEPDASASGFSDAANRASRMRQLPDFSDAAKMTRCPSHSLRRFDLTGKPRLPLSGESILTWKEAVVKQGRWTVGNEFGEW
jgi:hypothetical protein